jgi:kelch-like protein 1/4/5
LNGKLYAIGGAVGTEALAVNKVYTPGGVWVARSKMPTAREAFAAAVLSGKLFAFGGRLNGSVIAASHVYDAATNSWTSRAAMPQPRVSSNGADVINGRLRTCRGATAATGTTLRASTSTTP